MSNFTLKNRHYQLGLIFFISFFLSQSISAQTQLRFLEPKKKLTQYILDHWQSAEGLPTSNIRRVFQSKNGFLWMTSFDGLIRFDGVRFDLINKNTQQTFQSNATYLLDESPDSTLWIGTHGSGLLSFKNGIFKNWGFEDVRFTAIWVERNDRIWLSGRGKGLFVFNPTDGSIEKMAPNLLDAVTVNSIEVDEQSNVWIGTNGKGIFKYAQGHFQHLSPDPIIEQSNIISLHIESPDKIWVCSTKGLFLLQNGRLEVIAPLKGLIVYKIEPDLSGSLWIATSSGLFRRNALSGEFEQLPYRKETPLTNVLDLLLDREGSLWIATYRSGLFRLKDGKFNNFTYEDGLNTTSVGSVCELDDQSILVGMNDGTINLINEAGISTFPIQTPLPKVRVFNILQDTDKNLWISTFNKLLKIDSLGREKSYTQINGLPDNIIRVTYEDHQGNIWVGTRSGGVVKIDRKNKIEVFSKEQGLSSNFIMDINQDRAGNILVATNDGGLNIILPDKRIKHYTKEQGLESDLIFSVYNDSENITWLASGGALSRVEGDKIFNFTAKEGLINDTPFDVLEDQNNHLWLTTSRGIVKVDKAQLNAFAQRQAVHIDWVIYDKHDGMKSEDCTGAAHSIKARDGKIWVPTNGGLVVIDPANIPMNHLPPLISINSLHVDNNLLNIHQAIALKPGRQRVIFDYSALSLIASSKIRFRYKLENFDEAWNEGGAERQAIYTNIPPGEYTFRVIACNNDGVWNEIGARLSFYKEPHFHETYLFLALCILLALGVFYGIFRWRIYSIKQNEKELERQVEVATHEIAQQNRQLAQQKNLLQHHNQNMLNSINYASRIQNAILPPLAEIEKAFPESFVLYKPRDIVSGDFYWFSDMANMQSPVDPSLSFAPVINQRHNKVIISAADCTGHGVPGAFMSMIGNDLLNEIVNVRKITSPEQILSQLQWHINLTLKQQDNANRDGMEIGICVLDPEKKILEFAGARTPLYYFQNGHLQEIKGNRMPIGGYYRDYEKNRNYTKNCIDLSQATTFYMFSDGFQDQFNDQDRKKFGRNRLREMLAKVHQLPMKAQREAMEATIEQWKGNENQIDDILVVGFRLDLDG